MINPNLWLLGVDPAQTMDYTAFAVVHMVWSPEEKDFVYHLTDLFQFQGPIFGKRDDGSANVVETIERSMKLLQAERSGAPTYLCLDGTGIGATIKNYLKDLPIFKYGQSSRIYSVLFTSGQEMRYIPMTRNYNTGTVRIYNNMLALQQRKRFDYDPTLPLIPELDKQIFSFRNRLSPSGHQKLGAAEGVHDDLIAAISVALIVGEEKLNVVKYNRDQLSHARANWHGPDLSTDIRDHIMPSPERERISDDIITPETEPSKEDYNWAVEAQACDRAGIERPPKPKNFGMRS